MAYFFGFLGSDCIIIKLKTYIYFNPHWLLFSLAARKASLKYLEPYRAPWLWNVLGVDRVKSVPRFRAAADEFEVDVFWSRGLLWP